MAQLFADENFPLPSVHELRRRGHDVVTLREVGWAGQALSDPDVLALAGAAGRAVLTLNRRHFARLHVTHPTHAGIIVASFDSDFVALAARIDRSIGEGSPLSGALVRVNRPQR